MDIIFKGNHTGDELTKSVLGVVRLFKERYHVPMFREIHLTVTLVDEAGNDVELVDNDNSAVYRTFEVYRQEPEVHQDKVCPSKLTLVVDNTSSKN